MYIWHGLQPEACTSAPLVTTHEPPSRVLRNLQGLGSLEELRVDPEARKTPR